MARLRLVALTRPRVRSAIVLIATGALLASSAALVLAADQSVSIAGSTFQPSTVTVNVGDSVTWTNNDQISHTATADGGSFNTGTIGSGESRSVTFNSAGSFPYHCSIHPSMQATVVVQAASSGGGGGGGGAGGQLPGTSTEIRSNPGGSPAPLLILSLAVLLGAFFGRELLRRPRRIRIGR